MRNEDVIRKIHPGLIQEDGRLKPFSEQLLEYEYGVYPKDKPFVISNTTMRLNDAFILPHPITMTQSTVNKIKKKHDIDNTFIMRIERMLRNNVLIMESRNKHRQNCFIVVTDCVDKQDHPIILILKKDYRIGYNLTNCISSMYGKENIERLIDATFHSGCAFYPNEKTEHWLSSQRLQLSPDVAFALSYDYNTPNAVMCQGKMRKSGNRKPSLDDLLDDAVLERNSRRVSHSHSHIRKDYRER